MFFKRLAFLDFVQAMLAASTEPHALEIRSKIVPRVDRVGTFVANFTKCPGAAAIGAGQQQDQEPEEEGDNTEKQGLSHATGAAVEQFLKELTATGKLFAELLVGMYCGKFDEEFLQIADAELKTAAFTFALTDLFKGKPEDKVSGMELPLLHAGCVKWIESTVSQPTSGDTPSAIGDADRLLHLAQRGEDADREEDHSRTKLVAKLEELLGRQMLLGVLEGSEYKDLGLTRVLRALEHELREKQPQGAREKQAKGTTIFLLNAELFPDHGRSHSTDTFRANLGAPTASFHEALKWLVTAKQRADVAIIGDGRSDLCRDKIREWLKSAVGDAFLELWVVYEMETALSSDVRNPKRKVAWSGANMETLFVLLPSVEKGQRKGH